MENSRKSPDINLGLLRYTAGLSEHIYIPVYISTHMHSCLPHTYVDNG